MSIRAELERATADAVAALPIDPRGHLPLGLRQAIWAALGGAGDEGRRARARLAVLAARHVLPIWERACPGDRLPHRLLELAEQAMAGKLRPADADRELRAALPALDERTYRAADQAPIAAGYAAAHALTAAVSDEAFDPEHPDPDARDEDVDPLDHDSSHLAAIAAAGGPPWHAGSDVERRRQFWRWWLDDAVPAAAGS
jgi:hypothetical protein